MTKLMRQGVVGLIALIATLGVLWGFTTLNHYQSTIQPLQVALQKAPGVKHVTLKGNQVHVVLGKVSDFDVAYKTIDTTSNDYLANPKIDLVSHADPRLQAALERLSFPIEQGLALGQFVTMQQEVLKDAKVDGVTADLYIDNHNVYLALYGKTHYVYHVFPRGVKNP